MADDINFFLDILTGIIPCTLLVYGVIKYIPNKLWLFISLALFAAWFFVKNNQAAISFLGSYIYPISTAMMIAGIVLFVSVFKEPKSEA